MKKRVIPGLVTLITGALFILVPLYLFPVCEAQIHLPNGGAIPMKCFWTGHSEAGLGVVIMLSGVLLLLCASLGVRMGISIMNILLSVLAFAFPAFLIGMCDNENMPCRIGTQPALYLLCAILFVVSLLNVLSLRRQMKATEGK